LRAVCLALALFVGLPAAAQDAPKKKKPAAAKKQKGPRQATHQKPTPEQIRKFNELEKKKKQ
jgi:hypothetical protein